jgi:hypothetical protein
MINVKDVFDMKSFFRILACVLWATLLASCVPVTPRPVVPNRVETHPEQVLALHAQWGEEDARINEALGERVYDKDSDVVFSAAVTGLADNGFVVKNMERQSGYILAEGFGPIPPAQFKKLAQMGADELNKVSSRHWSPQVSSSRSVTITVLRLGDQKTKVKMRIVRPQTSTNSNGNYFKDIYPAILQAEYQCCWQALEKQMFLDENLDKAKP